MTTLIEGTNAFLANISKSKSRLTWKAYYGVLLGHRRGFLATIQKSIKYDDPIEKLTEKHAMAYMQDILDLSPATRQLNAACIRRFYAFVAGNDWATVSLDRLNFLLEGANVLTPVHAQITYDRTRVRELLAWVKAWTPKGNTKTRRLRALRDKAFILTLAQSGLRVHEACNLKIEDVNWETEEGLVIGKGNKQARFKIGHIAVEAIQCYLEFREKFIHVVPTQAVFARHDRKAGKSLVKHMSPQTGEAIIHEIEQTALGSQTLTCHALRHEFVTRILVRTKNLKSAQELARHTNITMTQRYAHLLDEETDADFNEAFNADE